MSASGALRRRRLTERPVSGPPSRRTSTHCTTGRRRRRHPDDAASPVSCPASRAVPESRRAIFTAPAARTRGDERADLRGARRVAAVAAAPATPRASPAPRRCSSAKIASRSRFSVSGSARRGRQQDEAEDDERDQDGDGDGRPAAGTAARRHVAARTLARPGVSPAAWNSSPPLSSRKRWTLALLGLEPLGHLRACSAARRDEVLQAAPRGRRAAGRRGRRPAGRRRCPSAAGPRRASGRRRPATTVRWRSGATSATGIRRWAGSGMSRSTERTSVTPDSATSRSGPARWPGRCRRPAARRAASAPGSRRPPGPPRGCRSRRGRGRTGTRSRSRAPSCSPSPWPPLAT